MRCFCLALFLAGALAAQQPRDLGYKAVPDWPQLPAGWNFGEVAGVETDSRGRVLVFHRGPHPIVEFEGSGEFARSWGDDMITRAHAVRVDHEKNIWIIDVGAHVVLKANPQARVTMVLGRKGISGTGPNSFNQPTDIAVAPNGDFYVSDGYGNSRVVKFSREGNFLLEWGKKGSGPGEFDLPHAIVLDARGRVYVADRSNHRIQIFDSNGKYLSEWKHVGSISGLDITPDQQIWAAGGAQVILLNLEGQILGRLAPPGKLPGQVAAAHAIAAGPAGEIYVGELNWRVQKFVKK